MTQAIDRDSFELSHTEEIRGTVFEKGTVNVTLGNQTRRVPASRWISHVDGTANIAARGMYGTYRTSANRWPASITSMIRNGEVWENANFGRDDRSGRFNKMRGIAFGEAD